MYSISVVFVAWVSFASLGSTSPTDRSLLVNDTPNSVRPYILPYLTGTVTGQGTLAYRFPVTSLSSGGTFTLLTTNTNAADGLSVFPHTHEARYENFFCIRGATQLWFGQTNGTQDVRTLAAGDYGASPSNTTHTFQTLQPDTEMVGVVFPGGIEYLFYATSLGNATYPASTPYDPVELSLAPGGVSINYTSLEKFDIYYQPNFVPRRDIVNGTAPANSGWHVEKNDLPQDSTTPYYIAKDFGPKYLSSRYGYQIIDTLNTATQSAAHNFTLSYITMDKLLPNTTIPWHKYPGHAALRIEQGSLILEVENYTKTQMLQGDVAFIPGNTGYRYYSSTALTKFLYAGSGLDGLDTALLADSKPWGYPTWPTS